MTVSKLSQIASSPSNPVSADTFVGVHGGNTDYQFSLSQVASGLNSSGLLALQPATSNLTFFVATTGSDSNPGTALLPFATIQHAVSVAVSFHYQSLYIVTVNVANGTYHENVLLPEVVGIFTQGFSFGAFLTGNTSVPANVIIAPTGSPADVLLCQGGQAQWTADGFTLTANPSDNTGVWTILHSSSGASLLLGAININTGTTSAYGSVITASNVANLIWGLGAVFNDVTVTGNGAGAGTFVSSANRSRLTEPSNWFFNSAINLGGNNFYNASNHSKISSGSTYNTPGNVTNGNPINLSRFAIFDLGSDPTTVTFPGGAFDPSHVDKTSIIDQRFYLGRGAGTPVDQSSIYRGSWEVYKDTNQTTAGLGLNLYVDDAGTVVPLIALTPAPGNLTFFVATTGSDSNPGTSGSPFRTIQHAINFALGFHYQNKYFPAINVANGTYHENIKVIPPVGSALDPNLDSTFELIGNTSVPTNCVIAPNSGSTDAVADFRGPGIMSIDGFSLKADTSPSAAGALALLSLREYAFVVCGSSLDFNLTAGTSYSNVVNEFQESIFFGDLNGGQTYTVQGTGLANCSDFANLFANSHFGMTSNTIQFNTAVAFASSIPFFSAVRNSTLGLNGTAFSGSLPTGGFPLSLSEESAAGIGADPTTITWPGGAFDPTKIDGSSTIDGFFYGQQNAGQLVDETAIYRGSWRIFKDTTGKGTYAAYDDGGKILINAFAASAASMHANMGGL